MNAIAPSAYHTLDVETLSHVTSARLPLQPIGDITMDSPASELVTDFAVTAGRSIQGSDSIGQALATMKQAGVRLLLVAMALVPERPNRLRLRVLVATVAVSAALLLVLLDGSVFNAATTDLLDALT